MKIESESESEEFEKESVKSEAPKAKVEQTPAPVQSNQQVEVIVGNLPFTTGEVELRSHFGKCKSIISVRLMMGQDGRPRGKAFIKFGNVEDMNKAIAMNNSQISGRNITVEQTRPRENNYNEPRQFNTNMSTAPGNQVESTNIIVRNLPFQADEEILRATFSDCGDIKAVRIMKNEDGSSRGFGFVDFYSVESARKANQKNGVSIQGRQIRIEFSLPRGPGGYQGKPAGGFGNRNGGNQGGQGNERRGFISTFEGEQFDL